MRINGLEIGIMHRERSEADYICALFTFLEGSQSVNRDDLRLAMFGL